MFTNEEIRRRRLKQLCEQWGGPRAVADKAGMNWATLDQIIKQVKLPLRQDGTRKARTLGDAGARTLEESFKLQPGWFDWPFEHVDFNDWASLSDKQREAIEAQLQLLVAQQLDRRLAPVK